MEHLLDCVIAADGDGPEHLLRGLPDDDLEAFVVALKAHLDAGNAWLLQTVEELDRRRVPERKHVLANQQWLGSAE